MHDQSPQNPHRQKSPPNLQRGTVARVVPHCEFSLPLTFQTRLPTSEEMNIYVFEDVFFVLRSAVRYG